MNIAATTAATTTRPHVTLRARLALLALAGLLALVFGSCIIAQIQQRYGVEVVVEGQEWNEQSLRNVEHALSLLPDHVVSNLGNPEYGPLHVLSNREGATLDGFQPYVSGANFYSNHNERNELVLLPNARVFTVLHELAHAYQMRDVPSDRYAWVIAQPELQAYMEATGWELVSSDAELQEARSIADLEFAYHGPQVWNYLSNFDPAEDYANAFALYFSDPDELQRRSAERYEFMRDYVAATPR